MSLFQTPFSPRTTPLARPLTEGASLDLDWVGALKKILAAPNSVRVHYQPIVDLQRGVVRGYEALARFPDAAGVQPRDWFDAAARLGFSGALEAQLTQAALVSRPLLTRDRFIAVNVSPAALLSDEVTAVLAAEASLEHIVLEVVDQNDGADVDDLRFRLDELRARQALIAVDDAGSGYSSLDRVIALRPHFVKVDGSVIAGIERDPGRVEMIRTLGELAARLDARVVAEGIETTEQLDTLVRLGVPMGQGFALGRPAPTMGELNRTVATHMRQRTSGGVSAQQLGALVELAPAVPLSCGPAAVAQVFAGQPHLEHAVVLATDGRPAGVIDRPAHERGTLPRLPLCLLGVLPVADAARRAMARPLATRFDPVVAVDQQGAYLGVVPIDRIVGALAR